MLDDDTEPIKNPENCFSAMPTRILIHAGTSFLKSRNPKETLTSTYWMHQFMRRSLCFPPFSLVQVAAKGQSLDDIIAHSDSRCQPLLEQNLNVRFSASLEGPVCRRGWVACWFQRHETCARPRRLLTAGGYRYGDHPCAMDWTAYLLRVLRPRVCPQHWVPYPSGTVGERGGNRLDVDSAGGPSRWGHRTRRQGGSAKTRCRT